MSQMIGFVQKKSVKERVWKTLNVIVGISTLLNVSLVGAMIAPKVAQAATTSLTVQVLSWNTIGLDSNKPTTQGPDSFLVQARVTNTGAATANNVQATMTGPTASTHPVSLVSSPNFTWTSIAGGASKDVFYVVKVDRVNSAYGTTTPYTITITSPDATTTATSGQGLYIEHLISQNRNSVQSATVSPASPLVGQPFTVTVVTTTTGNGNFDDVSPLMTYNPALATLDSVTTHYDIPGSTESDIYSQLVGGTMTSTFHFRATGAGTQNFYYLIYDHSGGSFHYNADFGGAITVPVQPRQALTKTVDKATANPGDALTYTLNYANLGNVDLTNVVITETYNSHFVFGSATPAPTSGNNIWNIGTLAVGASGSITIHGTLDSNFAAGTTTTVHNVASMDSDQTDPVTATADTTVTVLPNGSLKLTKIVDSGTASPDSFSFTIAPDPNGVGTIHTTGGTYVFTNLPAGAYTVTEQAMANYHQVSSTCSSVNVTANTQATCVVHNARDTGTLKVIKHVVGGTAVAGNWQLHVKQNGTDVTNSPQAGSETGTSYVVPTGTYNVSEDSGPTGYTASFSASCPSGVITVTKDATATCTVTNTRDQGNVHFLKVVDNEPNADLSKFTFHANGNAYKSSDSANFDTGSYTVTEDAVTGYSFVSASGICSYANGTITMNVTANGGTCTITNHRDTGTLVIQKDVINPDGGPVNDAHQFTVSVSGQSNGTIAEGTNATYSNLPTGTYTVTELADGSYSFVSYSVDNDNSAANGAQVTITKNGTTTLLVTNMQKKVQIIVHKNVVGIDGQTDVTDAHAFTASVNGAQGTIAEGTNFSTSVNPGSVSVSELPDANYALVSITPSSFNVSSGDQPVNVYVVNKQLPAHITVYKDVRAWDGTDTNDGHTFMTTLDNTTKNFGEGAPATFSVAPGTYSATEVSDPNYTLKSILPAGVTVGSNGSASITITNWQNKVFDWTVTKTGPATVQAGGQMTYNVTWQVNQGSNSQLANIVVTDPLPVHTSFVSADNGGTYDSGSNTVTWNLSGPFIPGQTGLVHLTVAVDNHLDATTITNVANVCGDQQPYFPTLSLQAFTASVDSTHVCKDGTAITNVLSSYTLGVSKTDNQTTTVPGATYAYTVNWNVDGNAATTGALTIVDTLPANVSFVSASNGGVYDSGARTVTWTLGSKAVPSSGNMTVTVHVDSPLRNGTDLHNTVQLCDDQQQCVNGDDHTTVVADYQLTVVKTGTPDPVQAGNDVTYSLHWTLSGNTPVDSLTLSDTLPAGVTFASCSDTCDHTSNPITWNLGSFPSGVGSGTVTVTVHIASPLANGTTYVNNAQICGSSRSLGNLDSINHCNTGSFTTHVQSDFSVNIVKLDTPDPVQAGGQITYTLNWSTSGNAPIDDLVISDDLPANTGFVSASNGGQLSNTSVFWDLGAHNPGDSGSVTLVVSVVSPLANNTVINNTAQVCGFSNPADDSDVIEHCGTGSTTTTVSSDFDVSIVKTADQTVQAGAQLAYTLTWDTSGNSPIDNLVITDPLPAHVSFVSADNGGTYDSGTNTVTWNLGAHTPGDDGVVHMTVLVDSPLYNGTVITNTGKICGSAEAIDGDHCDTSTTTTTVISDYSVSIVKTAPQLVSAGGQLTYVLTWNTTGNTPIDHLVISDVLPANTSFASASDNGQNTAGTVTWDLGAHNPGDNGFVTLTVNIASPLQNGTVITNTGKICGSTLGIEDEHCDTSTTTTTVTSDFTVGIAKAGPATAVPGTNITYVMTWTTTGNSPISNLVITDPIPANESFVSADNGGTYDSGTNTVTWNLGAHQPGDAGTVSLVVKLATPIANGTVITNTGKICGTAEGVEGQKCDTGTTTTTVTSSPTLSITKTNNIVGFTNPGKTVTYTVVVTNAADATDSARAVVLTDVLPAGFTYTLGGGSTKNFTLGDLAPGQSVTTTYTAVIASNQAAGTYTNTASAQGSNTPKVSATSDVTVRLPEVLGATSNPNLTITKTVNPTTTNPGKTVTYTVTITNTGDADATNVVLTDTLPTGLTFLDTGKSTQTWNIGTLAANHTRVITYIVKVGSTVKAGTYKNVAVVTADDQDPRQASANLKVTVPKVLGLATTGVGPRDYATFAAGLGLMALGFIWFARSNRKNESDNA